MHRKYLTERDGWIRMNQISPRMFEAIALKTALVLFEGKYSGVLRPGEHYIPLKKDFSNVEDVLRQLDDVSGLEEITERAYNDIVRSGRYSYRTFVASVDDRLDERIRHVKSLTLQSRIVGVVDGGEFGDAADEIADAAIGEVVKWPMLLKRFLPARRVESADFSAAREAATVPELRAWPARVLFWELLWRLVRRIVRIFPFRARVAIRKLAGPVIQRLQIRR
jgi:hypothetical protein